MWNQIKLHFKQSKRLTQYFASVSVISLMLPIAAFFFSFEAMGTFLQAVYAFMLLLMCVVCFIEANTQGIKDRRKVSLYKRYRLKGFVLGMAAQFFIWLITFVLLLFKDDIFKIFAEKAQNYSSNFLTLQFTNIMTIFEYKVPGYIISVLIIPVVCMVGYLLSYKNIDIDDKLGGIRKN